MRRITALSNTMIALFGVYLVWLVFSFTTTWFLCGFPLSGSSSVKLIYSSLLVFSGVTSNQDFMTLFSHLPVIWRTITGFVSFFSLVLSVWMTGLIILLFKRYSRRQIFDVWSVKLIRKIGWLFFAIQILYVLANTLEIFLTTIKTNPTLYITFGTAEAKAFALGLIVLVISRIMYEDNRLQKKLTVSAIPAEAAKIASWFEYFAKK